MKNLFFTLILCTSAIFSAACFSKRQAVVIAKDDPKFAATEEIHKTFPAAALTDISVNFFNGPVDVQTTENDMVEVHITRKAHTEAELKRGFFQTQLIEYNGERTEMSGRKLLAIYGKERIKGWQVWKMLKREPEIYSHVMVKIPQAVSVSVGYINGDVTVGAVEGRVAIDGINGKVSVAKAKWSLQLININGEVSAAVAELQNMEEHFLNIQGINGNIDMKFLDPVSAKVEGNRINGQVKNDLPNVTINKENDGNYDAVIGKGGARIKLIKINGNTTFAPANKLTASAISQLQR